MTNRYRGESAFRRTLRRMDLNFEGSHHHHHSVVKGLKPLLVILSGGLLLTFD